MRLAQLPRITGKWPEPSSRLNHLYIRFTPYTTTFSIIKEVTEISANRKIISSDIQIKIVVLVRDKGFSTTDSVRKQQFEVVKSSN